MNSAVGAEARGENIWSRWRRNFWWDDVLGNNEADDGVVVNVNAITTASVIIEMMTTVMPTTNNGRRCIVIIIEVESMGSGWFLVSMWRDLLPLSVITSPRALVVKEEDYYHSKSKTSIWKYCKKFGTFEDTTHSVLKRSAKTIGTGYRSVQNRVDNTIRAGS